MSLTEIFITFFLSLFSIGIILINSMNMLSSERNRVGKPELGNFKPRTLVILPIKGIDFGLDLNLKSLKDQSYDNYDLLAIVDDKNDPCIPYLINAGIDYIITDFKCNKCSGKVRAIASALNHHREYEIYVIADSDIRVDRGWLSKLISPLKDKKIGIATTFPKFYPEAGFWSKVKMVWGLVGESMMSSELTRFAWGGSLAFRRDLMDDDFLENFSSNISDDIAILRIAKGKSLKVKYVSDALVNIHSDDDFKKFLEWSNRQTALSISGSGKVFLFGMIYYAVILFIIIASIVEAFAVSPLYSLFLLVPIYLSLINYRRTIRRTLEVIPITFLLFIIYPINLIIGFSKKKIEWRGVKYDL